MYTRNAQIDTTIVMISAKFDYNKFSFSIRLTIIIIIIIITTQY